MSLLQTNSLSVVISRVKIFHPFLMSLTHIKTLLYQIGLNHGLCIWMCKEFCERKKPHVTDAAEIFYKHSFQIHMDHL